MTSTDIEKYIIINYKLSIEWYVFNSFFQSFDGYVLSNYQDGRKWNQTSVSIHEGKQRLIKLCHISHHHFSNLHNTKTSISLERKQICQKGKRHSAVFCKSLLISSNYFSFHRHFKPDANHVYYRQSQPVCCLQLLDSQLISWLRCILANIASLIPCCHFAVYKLTHNLMFWILLSNYTGMFLMANHLTWSLER